MRPFKLGLSRPKSKKEEPKNLLEKSQSNMDTSEIDEINASRETIEDISDSHLRRAIKLEPESMLEKSVQSVIGDVETNSDVVNDSIVNLVNKITENNHTPLQPGPAENYDLYNKFEPKPGPSNVQCKNTLRLNFNDSSNDLDSSPENKLGIMSFYNMSKIFDMSLEDHSDHNDSQQTIVQKETHAKTDIYSTEIKTSQNTFDEDVKVKNEHSDTIKKYKDFRILTPRTKPPSKAYVMSTLQQYNIPKIRNLEPYYSDHKDVGDKIEIGQILLKVNSKLSRDQKPFEKVLDTTSLEEWRHLIFLQSNEISQEASKPDSLKLLLAGNRKCVLEPLRKPPTGDEVRKWLELRNDESHDKNLVKNIDISKNIDDLENSQALGLGEINNSISLEAEDKDKGNLNSSLQITMQPDGSFLCFGSNDTRQENSSIETPIVHVSVLHVYEVPF